MCPVPPPDFSIRAWPLATVCRTVVPARDVMFRKAKFVFVVPETVTPTSVVPAPWKRLLLALHSRQRHLRLGGHSVAARPLRQRLEILDRLRRSDPLQRLDGPNHP